MNKRQIFEKNVFEYDNANCIIKAQTFYKAVCHTKRLPSIHSKALILLHFFNYSMIEATRPDPTVLPPSRTFVPEIVMLLGNSKGVFNTFFLDMRLVSEVFGFFVIMVLSQGELHPFAF